MRQMRASTQIPADLPMNRCNDFGENGISIFLARSLWCAHILCSYITQLFWRSPRLHTTKLPHTIPFGEGSLWDSSCVPSYTSSVQYRRLIPECLFHGTVSFVVWNADQIWPYLVYSRPRGGAYGSWSLGKYGNSGVNWQQGIRSQPPTGNLSVWLGLGGIFLIPIATLQGSANEP